MTCCLPKTRHTENTPHRGTAEQNYRADPLVFSQGHKIMIARLQTEKIHTVTASSQWLIATVSAHCGGELLLIGATTSQRLHRAPTSGMACCRHAALKAVSQWTFCSSQTRMTSGTALCGRAPHRPSALRTFRIESFETKASSESRASTAVTHRPLEHRGRLGRCLRSGSRANLLKASGMMS